MRPGTGGSREILRGLTWQDIVAEIEKCDVVCKNWHEVRNTKRGLGSTIQGDGEPDAGSVP